MSREIKDDENDSHKIGSGGKPDQAFNNCASTQSPTGRAPVLRQNIIRPVFSTISSGRPPLVAMMHPTMFFAENDYMVQTLTPD
jgi:hypothetical protein